MDSIKFVWAYMIENGFVTVGEWDYYGGSWYAADGYDWRARDANMNKLRADVKKIGIDWDKTETPQSTDEVGFTDTESPGSKAETLIGNLVLKNGKQYLIGVNDAAERFTSYVRELAELAEDRQRVKDILGE